VEEKEVHNEKMELQVEHKCPEVTEVQVAEAVEMEVVELLQDFSAKGGLDCNRVLLLEDLVVMAVEVGFSQL
jgi:hypothetical protein